MSPRNTCSSPATRSRPGIASQAESYLQHAEHYYRIVSAAQAQNPQQPQQGYRNDADGYGDDDDDRSQMPMGDQRFQPFPHEQPSFGGVESQPYVRQRQRPGTPRRAAACRDRRRRPRTASPSRQPQPQPEANFRPEGGAAAARRPPRRLPSAPPASLSRSRRARRRARGRRARSPKAPGPAESE